jgi:RNA polymerase sigma factor (sigma-70 family)
LARNITRLLTQAGIHRIVVSMKELGRLAEAYTQARRRIVAAVRTIVRPADVDDILQEAFLRCLESQSERPVIHAPAYLLKTAVNLAINHSARAEQRLTTSLEALSEAKELPGGDDIESLAITRERIAQYCGIVAELPLQCRRAFVLKKVYGLSQRDIARFLNVSESTVEKHVAKGILTCAQRMRSLDDTSIKRPGMKAQQPNG